MTTKLTLSVDESVAALAKRVAKARNTSVSAMLSRLVAGLDAMDQPRDDLRIAPLTLAATGLARPSPARGTLPGAGTAANARSDEVLLEDALWQRYGPVE